MQFSELQSACSSTVTQATEALKQKEEDLAATEEQLLQLSKDFANACQDKEVLAQQVKELADSNEQLEAQISTLSDLSSSNAERCTELEERIHAMQSSTIALQDHESRMDELRRQQENQQQRCMELEQQLAEAKSQGDRLIAENSAMAALQSELSTVRSDAQELVVVRDQLAERAREVEALTSRCVEADEQIAAAKVKQAELEVHRMFTIINSAEHHVSVFCVCIPHLCT